MNPKGVAVLVAVLVALVTASCSSGSGGATSSTSEARAVADPSCDGRDREATTSERRRMMFDGEERQYQLSLPPAYDGSTPIPVILNLHGLTSDIEEQDMVSDLPEAGGERGYAIVTPQALPVVLPIPGGSEPSNFWNITQIFNPPTEAGSDSPGTTQVIEGASDDLGFLIAALDDVEQAICVDTAREYVTGISNGAGMTMALVCTNDRRFAAAAPVAGVNMGTICAATHATSIIAFHGDADPLVPYGGGDMFGYPLGLESVQERMGAAAALADCDPDPEQTSPSGDSTRLVWTCPDGYGMELYTIKGGGHTWPGVTTYVDPSTTRATGTNGPRESPFDIESIVGHQTTDIIATDLMLDFFDQHERVDGRER